VTKVNKNYVPSVITGVIGAAAAAYAAMLFLLLYLPKMQCCPITFQ
jgi:hypothetical protein